MKKAEGSMYGHELRFEDALRYQGPMRKHIEMNPKREQFMQDLKSEMDIEDINRKWADKPSLKLLWQKYVWGNRQKVFVWSIRNRKQHIKEISTMYYLNQKIENLVRIFDQNERKSYLRLDLNENPGGLPEEFVNGVLGDVTPQLIAQYPETLHFTEVLAQYLGTDIQHLCLVNGSAEGIRYIIQAFTSENGRIVGVVPSYFMFQVYSEMYGRNFVKVPYNKDLTMSIENIITQLTDDTQLLILLNPNNPMGNVYTDEEFKTIMQVCKEKQITVLIDEAYHYFYPKTFIQYALNERHVFVTRTFSKLFSMAGCRLGYVVGHPDDIKYVQKFCTPHNTNAFAMLFAERILTTPGMVESLVRKFQEGRSYLISELDDRGYHHKGEAGNFLFIEPKTKAQTIVERMKNEKKILIKAYENVGEFGDCLRVSIGEKKYMQQFMVALLELDK